MACPSAINSLHLSEAAVHEQFRSRDITAVFGCEKHNGFRDLIGRTQPAERNSITRLRTAWFEDGISDSGWCSFYLRFGVDEGHQRRDDPVGCFLHQPVTGTLHHVAGDIGRHQLRLLNQESAGRSLTRQYE